MSDTITTYKKIHMSPLEPEEKDIFIEDIAHALSLMTRANGHFPEFYSVAQHCVHCAGEALARGASDRIVLACLLHDASEAYLSDITRPVKKYLGQYKEIEKTLQDTIYRKYLGELTEEEAGWVKEIDDTLLYYEFLHYMGEALSDKAPFIQSRPVFATVEFKKAEQEYLQMFAHIMERLDRKVYIGAAQCQ